MNLQQTVSFCLNLFNGLGKECFSIAILVAGIVFCCKGLINGAQFVDLIKSIGMTYLASHTVNSTWGSLPDPKSDGTDQNQ